MRTELYHGWTILVAESVTPGRYRWQATDPSGNVRQGDATYDTHGHAMLAAKATIRDVQAKERRR